MTEIQEIEMRSDRWVIKTLIHILSLVVICSLWVGLYMIAPNAALNIAKGVTLICSLVAAVLAVDAARWAWTDAVWLGPSRWLEKTFPANNECEPLRAWTTEEDLSGH